MKSHGMIRRSLPLYLYGETTPEETARIEAHLRSCDECRAAHEELKRLSAALARTESERANDEALLEEARTRVRQALALERGRLASRPNVSRRLGILFSRPIRLAVVAAAILVCGILVGRLAPFPGSPPDADAGLTHAGGEARITGVRLLSAPDPDGMVELTYDQLASVHMKGSIDDPAIQKVLTRALLTEQNPGVRLRALTAITGPAVVPADREIKAALILALKADDNAAVRHQALGALRRYAVDREIRDAILHALMYDKNPGLRVAAINALDSLRVLETAPDPAAVAALRDRLRHDDNAYIRLRAQAVLMEAREQ